jgi:hypothetical protein
MDNFDLRKYLTEGRLLKENSFKKEEYKYLKITPEEFKAGDLFLMAPEDEGEFFGHKEATKISSITLPRDGRGNTAFIETEEGEKKLSVSSLYNIARKKSLTESSLLFETKHIESIIYDMLPNLKKEGFIVDNTFHIDFDEIGNFWSEVFEKAYGHEFNDLNDDDNDKFDNIQQLTNALLSQGGLNIKYDY